MAEPARAQPSIWPAFTACAIAAGFVVWMAAAKHNWTSMVAGPFAPLFWAASLLWVVCVAAAIVRQGQWWLLLPAPIVLYPLFMWVWLILACLVRGACL